MPKATKGHVTWLRVWVGTLCLVVVVLPWGTSTTALSLGLMGLVWAFGFVRYRRWRHIRHKRLQLVAFAYLSWMVIGVTYSQDVAWALTEVRKSSVLLLVPLVYSTLPTLPIPAVRFVLRAFVFGLVCASGVMLFTALTRYTHGESVAVFFYHELASPTPLEAIFMSFYLGIGLLVCLAKHQHGYRVWPRLPQWVTVGTVVVLASVLLLLASRMVIPAVLVAAFVLMLPSFKRSRRAWGYVAAGLLVGLLLVGLAPGLRQRVASLTTAQQSDVFREDYGGEHGPYTNGLTLRLIFWRLSFESLEGRWLAGHGPGDYQHALNDAYRRVNLPDTYQFFGAHNQYIQTLLWGGCIGLLLLLALLAAWCRFALAQRNRLLLALLVLLLLGCVTDTYLAREFGLTATALFVGLLAWHPLRPAKG